MLTRSEGHPWALVGIGFCHVLLSGKEFVMDIQHIMMAIAIGGAVAACSHEQAAPRANSPEPPAVATAKEPPPRVAFRAVEVQVSPKLQEACALPDSREDSPLFDFDRAELRARGETILDGVAACMQNGNLKDESVHAVGFADPRGTNAYNLELGTRRAEAAREYLEEQGISSQRIGVASCGKYAATGTDEATWAKDRRVELAMSDEALPNDQCSFDVRAAGESSQ